MLDKTQLKSLEPLCSVGLQHPALVKWVADESWTSKEMAVGEQGVPDSSLPISAFTLVKGGGEDSMVSGSWCPGSFKESAYSWTAPQHLDPCTQAALKSMAAPAKLSGYQDPETVSLLSPGPSCGPQLLQQVPWELRKTDVQLGLPADHSLFFFFYKGLGHYDPEISEMLPGVWFRKLYPNP